jgi:hypothetical protein
MTPQMLFMSGAVSNDIPAAAMGSLALWLLMRLAGPKPSVVRATLAGTALGLAALTKVSALALVAPCIGVVAWAAASRRASRGRAALLGSVIGLSALATGGWWYMRNWALYGSPFGFDTHVQARWSIDLATDRLLPFGDRWWEIGRSYWMAFGWGGIKPAEGAYVTLCAMALLAAGGLALAARHKRRRPGAASVDSRVGIGILAIQLLASAALLEAWQHRAVAPHGRLLFGALPAISILLVLGWTVWHRALAVACCGFVALWAALSPGRLIAPAYRMRFLAEDHAAALPRSLGVRFASDGTAIAELLHAETLFATGASPDLPAVRVCLRSLAEADRDYSVLVQVLGPDNRLVVSRRTYPGLGLYPTSIWLAGRAFCDLVTLPSAEDLTSPDLRLEIAMIDPVSDQRLQASGEDGRSIPYVFVMGSRLLEQ